MKELASRMSNPTAMSFHHLKKFLGPRVLEEGYGLLPSAPISTGRRRLCQERRKLLVLGNILRFRLEWKQRHRKSTSVGFHALNSCPLFNCSTAAELQAIVSSASYGVYIHAVLEVALGTKVGHYIYADSPSARQLVMKRGVGKVRRLDGKLLWIQNRKDFKMVQVPTDGT